MSLHNHIIPQEYLKHFGTAKDPELVWRYDKQCGKREQIPVKRVSQRKDFFSEVDERMLSENVEGPALRHLNKLREGKQLDHHGRVAIGEYLTRMVARTERIRLKMAESLSKDVAEARSNPRLWAMRWGVPVEPMLKYLNEKGEGLQPDPLRTKEPLLHQVLDFPEVRDHLVGMNWQVFTTDSSERFLTSDNPVFIGRAQGLKPPHGKFLFPLASKVALVGSWQGPNRNLTFRPAYSPLIKEFNRYVVSGAHHWLYFHEKADWVRKMVQNPSTRVGRKPW